MELSLSPQRRETWIGPSMIGLNSWIDASTVQEISTILGRGNTPQVSVLQPRDCRDTLPCLASSVTAKTIGPAPKDEPHRAWITIPRRQVQGQSDPRTVLRVDRHPSDGAAPTRLIEEPPSLVRRSCQVRLDLVWEGLSQTIIEEDVDPFDVARIQRE
jgi:hypothetical protein